MLLLKSKTNSSFLAPTRNEAKNRPGAEIPRNKTGQNVAPKQRALEGVGQKYRYYDWIFD